MALNQGILDPKRRVTNIKGANLKSLRFGVWDGGGVKHLPQEPETLNPRPLRTQALNRPLNARSPENFKFRLEGLRFRV